MDRSEPISTLLQRLRDGDSGAANILFARYSQSLARAAEQHLTRKLAGRVDGEDVVQSVFQTFFRRYRAGEFQIDTSAQLWRLLLRITLRKARFQARMHLAEKRNVNAEAEADDIDLALAEAVARDPDPAEVVALVEQLELLLKDLPELYAHILEQRLQGFRVAEIAARTNVSRQTVYRVLDLLGERLTQQFDE